MSMLLLLLLATVLSQQTTQVHLDSEGWVVDEKSNGVEVQWRWSARCAPQKIRAGDHGTCETPREVVAHVVDSKGRAVENAVVVWATAAMLRDLPDSLLPTTSTAANGRAVIAVTANEDAWVRIAGPELGTFWRRVRPGETAIRLDAAPVVPLRMTLRGEDGKAVSRGRIALLPVNCTTVCPERLLAFDVDKESPRMLGVAGSSYRIVAWSDSHAPITRMVAFSTTADLTLTLERGSSIAARIVDRERKPLDSAKLDVHFQLPGLREAVRRTASTSADGTVKLAGLPAGSVEWTASAGGVGRRTEQVPLASDIVDLGEIMLKPARRAVVYVVDGANVPVSGARVVARGSGLAATDGRGAATFTELPAEEIGVDVRASGFLPAQGIVAKEDAELTVRVERGAAIKAVLLRESDRQPPQGMRVRVTNNGSESLRAFDESDLAISGLQTGSARLRVSTDGTQPYDSGALTLTEGETLDLGLVLLKAGGVVRGVVADAAGAPVRDARVRALQLNGDTPSLAHVLGNWSEVTSAEDGTFRISGLTHGSQFLTIEAPGYAQRAISNVAFDDNTTEVDLGTIELTRGTRVELVCRPVAQCGSEASVLPAGPDFPFVALHSPLEGGLGSFDAVPAGVATLRLTRAKHLVHERTIELRADLATTTIELDLPSLKLRGEVVLGSERAGEGSLLFTRAVRRQGVPIMMRSQTPQGSTLGTEWMGSFGAATYVVVGAGGKFFVDGIAPGEYEVVFRTGSATTAPVRLELPETGEHTLRLQFEDREIAGVTRDANDRPALARVEVVDGAGVAHVTNSGLDGQFRLLGLSAGKATVKASASGRKAETTVDPAALEARNVLLRLTDEDRGGLSVTVQEYRGQPAAGVLVFLTERGGLRAASTDNDGRAVFRAVDESVTCAVAVHRLGGEWAFGTVRAGSPSRIVFSEKVGTVVAQSNGVSGSTYITTPNGFPLDQVLPMVGISTHLGSAGTLRLSGLPAGSYAVRVGLSQQLAMVSAGETTMIRFAP